MTWFLWLACVQPPTEAILSGQIMTGQDSGVGAADILVSIRNAETKPHGEVTTDTNGLFEISVPSSNVYHMILSGNDIAPTSFSGIIGDADLAIPVDELFVRTDADVEGLRAAFENCPTASDDGGVVEGIVQFRLLDNDDNSFLAASDAMVEVFNANGTQFDACYLDDDGFSAEEADNVGTTGRFAVFGVPEGPTTVLFKQDIGGLTIENYGFVYMPENGTAPFHPAFVDLAG
jgi:hypothetical protein